MSSVNFQTTEYFPYTMVSHAFIDEYMPSANPAYVVIYLYGLKNAMLGASLETKEVARQLNLLESDIVNAWNYWQEKKIIEIASEDDDFRITFLPIAAKAASAPKGKKKSIALVQTKPNYTTQELDIYVDKSEDVRQLFTMAQRIMGKLLTYNDMSTLFGFYDWLMLPMNVIEFLIQYCATNDHRNMRYIEKVALDWAEHEINTLEAAEEHVKLFNTDYREIMKAFGISKRDPVFSEQEFMKKWIFVYKMPMDLLKTACEKTILQTGKANFVYADSIINSWYLNNVQSLEDVAAQEEQFHSKNNEAKKAQKASNAGSSAPSAPKKNKFVNYEQRSWNFDQLKQMEEQLLDKELEG